MGYIANLNDLIQEDLDERARSSLAGESSQRQNDKRIDENSLGSAATTQRFYHGSKANISAFEVGHQDRKDRAKAKSGLVAILR